MLARTISHDGAQWTIELSKPVRYCSCHSNIKVISSRHRVISSMYIPFQILVLIYSYVKKIQSQVLFKLGNDLRKIKTSIFFSFYPKIILQYMCRFIVCYCNFSQTWICTFHSCNQNLCGSSYSQQPSLQPSTSDFLGAHYIPQHAVLCQPDNSSPQKHLFAPQAAPQQVSDILLAYWSLERFSRKVIFGVLSMAKYLYYVSCFSLGF